MKNPSQIDRKKMVESLQRVVQQGQRMIYQGYQTEYCTYCLDASLEENLSDDEEKCSFDDDSERLELLSQGKF